MAMSDSRRRVIGAGALAAALLLGGCSAIESLPGVASLGSWLDAGRAAPQPAPEALPAEREALIERGVRALKSGENAVAVAAFGALLDIADTPDEERARYYYNRGLAHDRMEALDAARADYDAAIALVPRYAQALNNRASLRLRSGDAVGAEADYRASVAAGNPEPHLPLYGIALARLQACGGQMAGCDTAEAQAALTAALSRAPDYAPAQTLKAQIAGLASVPVAAVPPAALPRAAVPPAAVAAAARRSPAPLPPEPAVALRSTVLPRTAELDPPAGATPARAAEARYAVQLGSYRSQSDAERGWDELSARAGDALGRVRPDIQAAEIAGRGSFYRLRAGGFASAAEAAALCERLKSQGLACLPVRF